MIADVIDTIHIMGLRDEFKRARDWIANDLSFEHNGDFSTFEVRNAPLGVVRHSRVFSDNNPRPWRSTVCILPL